MLRGTSEPTVAGGSLRVKNHRSGLKQDAGLIRTVMPKLVFVKHAYWAAGCDCGKVGFKHGR